MTSARKLNEGDTVFTEIRLGDGLFKRRMGTVNKVGHRGAHIKFDNGIVSWVESSRIHMPEIPDMEGANDVKDSKPPTMPRIPSGPFRTDGRAVVQTPPPNPAEHPAAPAVRLAPPPQVMPAATAAPANDPQGILQAMRESGRDPFAMLVALAEAMVSDRRRAVTDGEAAVAKADDEIRAAEEMLTDARKRKADAVAELDRARAELTYSEKLSAGGAR